MFCFPNNRSCDNTLENCFFQISSHSRAYLRINCEKTGLSSLRPLLGKQNIQAKKAYSAGGYRVSFPAKMTRYHVPALHSIEKIVPVVVRVVDSKGLFLNFLVNLHFFFFSAARNKCTPSTKRNCYR